MMTTQQAAGRRSVVWEQVLIIVYLIAYILASADNYAILKLKAVWLQDLRYYERATTDATEGPGPYTVLAIGPGFLYPPPSLLLIEPIKDIKREETKVRVVNAINFLAVAGIIWGLIRYFKLSHLRLWYWYVLGFFYGPLRETAYLGQINVVPLCGLSLFFLCLERRWFISGLGLSIATLTKVSPGIFFIYALIARSWRVTAAAIFSSIALCGITAMRYGLAPFLEYPGVLRWLSKQLPLGINPQSFEARMVWLQQITVTQPESFGWLSPFVIYCHDNFAHQRGMTWYLCGVLLLTSFFLYRSKEERAPSFAIFCLAMTLAPNVMWYHHYTFLILPLLVWMGYAKLAPQVVYWCLLGMLIIQVDRWALTHGLLIHIFAHFSLLALLTGQAARFCLNERLARADLSPSAHQTSVCE
jgi:hypothetical protein